MIVLNFRSRANFLHESPASSLVVVAGEDDLQRDQPARRKIPRPVDDSHPPAADLGLDVVCA